MEPFAKAYANNDVAIISWKYYAKIDACLGFQVQREDQQTGEKTALPAWVGFENQQNPNWEMKDTSVWPVQKFSWKDVTAPKNKTFIYHIIPMVGTEDHLQPIADQSFCLTTSPVSISPGTGPVKAYFNRGILSTQFVARSLSKNKKGQPDLGDLKKHIGKPGDKLRDALAGDLIAIVPSLLEKARAEKGFCYLALYELTDPELIADLKEAKDFIELILSNANGSKTTIGPDGKKHTQVLVDDENKEFRQALKNAGVTVHDRFVPDGHIGHNKFVVYLDKNKVPQIVLSGSTNWTANGLCAQSNNTIVIEDQELATSFKFYWDRLLADTTDNNSQQGSVLRQSNQVRFPTPAANPGVWFSPNTDKAVKAAAGSVDINNDPHQPVDLKDMFTALEAAQKSILFLEFQPGSPSVLDKILSLQQRKPNLYIRGAATDANAIEDYNTALFSGKSAMPDFYNVVAASAIKDQFSYWEAELLSAGHAIIHNKIVVIDPFTDNCRVFTGSHNNGYRASAFNDENLLSIAGNKQIAAAYAAHVIDIYDHYRWRYTLQTKGKDQNGDDLAYKGLKTTDEWQSRYFDHETGTPVIHMTVPHPTVD